MRHLIGLLGLLFAAACGSPAPSALVTAPPAASDAASQAIGTPIASASRTVAPSSASALATPAPPPEGVRACDYDPLLSVAAEMPPEVTVDPPDPPQIQNPPNSTVDAGTTQAQLGVFLDLVQDVEDHYVYIDLDNLNWPDIVARYRTLIEGGLTDDDFYLAMENMIIELGDDHSFFENPEEVIASDEEQAGTGNFVGVGVMIRAVPDTERAVIMLTYPDGAAAEAGIKSHDAVLEVDGEPILDADGLVKIDKIRGVEGTTVVLRVQTPGQEPRDVTLERRPISSTIPVDFCMIPRTTIGYVMVPTLIDQNVPERTREALRALTSAGPLDGLIVDNRQNSGGLRSVLDQMLGFFSEGNQGFFVSRDERRPMDIQAEPIGNSQTVPLVVLVGDGTASFGEVLSGVLQNNGRAEVVGQTTRGNVEALAPFLFDDGSRAWLAYDAFEPAGLDIGVWEETGIVPDVVEPTRWDLITEANDPALKASLEVLATEGVEVPEGP
jgi:carboxyl-terminal processing protease